jgi:hypothetical protein
MGDCKEMKWNKNEILIVDNFFDEPHIKEVHIDLNNLIQGGKFVNRYVAYNNTAYQQTYFNVDLSKKHFAVDYIKNFFLKKYDIKIKQMASHYWFSGINVTPTPHLDDNFLNCCIQLKGNNLLHNGLGIYEEENGKSRLHTHLGFKENRAIIFDGMEYMHATLQSFGKQASPRYIMVNFISKDCL